MEKDQSIKSSGGFGPKGLRQTGGVWHQKSLQYPPPNRMLRDIMLKLILFNYFSEKFRFLSIDFRRWLCRLD
jgi:hypothetical protein